MVKTTKGACVTRETELMSDKDIAKVTQWQQLFGYIIVSLVNYVKMHKMWEFISNKLE